MMAFITLWLTAAFAGDHHELCDKVRASDIIVEAVFRPTGEYPESHRSKGWGPTEESIQATTETGVITHVLKGDWKVFDHLPKTAHIGFSPGQSVREWDKFYKNGPFAQILFLEKREKEWVSTAWAEESAGCDHSAHVTWCKGYGDYKTRLLACKKSP